MKMIVSCKNTIYPVDNYVDFSGIFEETKKHLKRQKKLACSQYRFLN